MSDWIKDDIGHFSKVIDADHTAFVYKSEAGDWLITVELNGAPCGGELEYADTKAKALKLADRMIADGTWIDLSSETIYPELLTQNRINV
jgi:hypothetical protein